MNYLVRTKSHPTEPKAVVSFKSLSDGDYYRRYLTKISSNILSNLKVVIKYFLNITSESSQLLVYVYNSPFVPLGSDSPIGCDGVTPHN